MSNCLIRYKERIAKHKEKCRAHLAQQRQDPEFNRKQSEGSSKALTEMRQDPIFNELIAESHRTPEAKEKARQTLARNRENPEFIKAVYEGYANLSEEERERRSQNMEDLWKTPEFRAAHLEARNTPEEIERVRRQFIKLNQNPEFAKKKAEAASKRMTKMHKDPEFRKKITAGFHVPYDGINGHIPMRSSWEVLFAKLLDFLGFHWKYEPKQYNMSFEGLKTPNYTPDFWVDELGYYFEVKGRDDLVELAKARAEICQLLHGVKVVVLDGATLKDLGLWKFEQLPKLELVQKLEKAS